MPKTRHHSLGELISTVTFFGSTIYLVLTALQWHDMGDTLRASISWFAALLCFLGALRFRIASWVMTIQKLRKSGHDQS
jgi:hypothetical protein